MSAEFGIAIETSGETGERTIRGGRGAGFVTLAEAERGARRASVSTFSRQARLLYKKLGFHVFGELPYRNGAQLLYRLEKPFCA